MIYHVSFPKLGINLKINPTLFSFAGITVKWYGVIIAFGFLLALLYIVKRCQSFGLKKNDVENLVLFSSAVAIICARIYYVVFYPGDFYAKNPSKILLINEGGIAIYGAIIGGFLATLVYCKINKKNFFATLDLMSLGLLIGQCIGRWGNFVNQEAFGGVTTLPWGMMSENTCGKTVHPCFLYESICCLICFLVLHFYTLKKKARKPGKIFFIYTAYYGIIRAIIESLRTDSLIIPGTNLRVSQVLAVAAAAVSIIILKLKYRTSRN